MIFLVVKAQEKQDSLNLKQNPIAFADINLGYAIGSAKGFSAGVSFYYQKEKQLFTFRILQNVNIEKVDLLFGIFPTNIDSKTLNEYSFLYGKRFIDTDRSYHFSAGISYNTFKYIKKDIVLNDKVFIGFPIEMGMHFFNAKKEKFRVLYGLIPLGKPTSFARSYGFKLYANIAKKSYIGLGISIGLGWHKIYTNEK
jgi:hypothetical protein